MVGRYSGGLLLKYLKTNKKKKKKREKIYYLCSKNIFKLNVIMMGSVVSEEQRGV